MEDKVIISLQIPKDLDTKIREDAKQNYMTNSAYIRMLLLKYYSGEKLCYNRLETK